MCDLENPNLYMNKIHDISVHCYIFQAVPFAMFCRLLLFSKNLILFMPCYIYSYTCVCTYVTLETETCLLLISTMLLKIEFDKIHILYRHTHNDMCV